MSKKDLLDAIAGCGIPIPAPGLSNEARLAYYAERIREQRIKLRNPNRDRSWDAVLRSRLYELQRQLRQTEQWILIAARRHTASFKVGDLITFEDTVEKHTRRMRIVVLNGGFAWTGYRWVRLDECVHIDEV